MSAIYAPLILVVFGGAGLVLRWRKGLFLTPATGWHGTLFLMYGLSGLASLVEPPESRVPASLLLPAYDVSLRYLAAGQVLAFVADWWMLRRRARVQLPSSNPQLFRVALWVSAAALVGHTATLAGMGASSVSTVFTVLGLFRYPSIIFLVFSSRSPRQRLIAVLLTSTETLFAVISPWRSELIFVSAAILLGIALRNVRRVALMAALGLSLFVYLLPFLDARKVRLDEFHEAPFDFFMESQDISFNERMRELAGFVAIRMNQGRDLAHVVLALESGQLQPIGLAYYGHMAAQLVPRVLWPEKPSFNVETGYELPRMIGLVSPGDEVTSWGVGLLGEVAYAHGLTALTPAVPLVLFLLMLLERLTDRVRWRQPVFRLVLGGSFLFLFLSPGSPINLGTYVLWLVLLTYCLDAATQAVHAVPGVAGGPPPLARPLHTQSIALGDRRQPNR